VVQRDAAFVRRNQADHHVERGGLASAVRPQQADHLALAQRQVHIVHDSAFAEALFQAGCDQALMCLRVDGGSCWHGYFSEPSSLGCNIILTRSESSDWSPA